MGLTVRFEKPRLSAEEDARRKVADTLAKFEARNLYPIIPSAEYAMSFGECNWCSTKIWQNAWTGNPGLCPACDAKYEAQKLQSQLNAEAALELARLQAAKMKGSKKLRKQVKKMAKKNGNVGSPDSFPF